MKESILFLNNIFKFYDFFLRPLFRKQQIVKTVFTYRIGEETKTPANWGY